MKEEKPEIETASVLEKDVRHLAEVIGERNMSTAGTMSISAEWIEQRMNDSGLSPYRHNYTLSGGVMRAAEGGSADNIISEIPGKTDQDKIVVIGAHYDTVPFSPGANDNASAVAVLLDLCAWITTQTFDKTVRLVSFANEEPPYFLTSNMGSYAYAAECRHKNENIVAMISMDGVGCFSENPKSQQYPVPGLRWCYPDKADFIGMVTRVSDRSLLRRVLKSFRSEARISVQGAALPAYTPGVFWSDHWSFWKHNYPALLVTDTLPFRDQHYHTPNDTPDRLDYIQMARVALGLRSVVADLADSRSNN